MKDNIGRKGIVLGIILLLVGAGVIPSTVGNIEKMTIFTNRHSPGYIQDLIDNATSGDTIYIPSGTYYENIIINKSISLIGEDRNTTVIDGSGSGDVVNVSADWVNISRFTIQNSSSNLSNCANGINISSNYNAIFDNIISNNGIGIDLYGSENTIRDNDLTGNGCCFFSWCSGGGLCLDNSNNNTIIRNNISNNAVYGVYIEYSRGNSIEGNEIQGNGNFYGAIGIVLYFSNNNVIIDNYILEHDNVGWGSNDGILFYTSNNNAIIDNTIEGGGDIEVGWGGIYLSDSNNNIITGNSILLNGSGINLDNSNNTTIIDNSLFYNGLCVYNSFHNNVQNNTINGKPLVYLEDESDEIITNAGQVILVNCDNITLENLNISRLLINGIVIWETNNSKIWNNDCLDNSIILYNSCNNIIKSNNVSNRRYWYCLYLDNSNDNTIIDNIISCEYSSCISILDSNNNTINNNIISDSDYAGINLGKSNSNTITNNIISKCFYGIDLGDSIHNTITNNIISKCVDGIVLIDSNHNTIMDNPISNNGDGIYLRDSNHNTIMDNTISNNGDGIYLRYSYRNTIQKNNFLNNNRDAFFKYKGIQYLIFKGNRWKRNYWNSSRILPKLIQGELRIEFDRIPNLRTIDIKWFNIDWRPALKPYEIGV